MTRRWGGRMAHRGQIILIAAIGIALTLITLGLVLNAVAIPTAWWSAENVNSVDAVSTTGTMVEGYGAAMFNTNFDHCLGNAALSQEFTESGATWREWFARIENIDGSTVNSTVQETTMGAIVKQRHYRNFTNKSGASDWNAITDRAGVRRFTMNVTDENLKHPSGGISESTLEGSGAFHVRLANGTETREVYVYETDSGGIGVAVVDPGNGLSASPVTVSGSNVILDFTEGTVGGERVQRFPDIEPPYSIRFEEADHVKGRYLFVTSTNESKIDNVDSHFYERCGRQAPCTERAIYNATVRFATNSSAVAFETTKTIAPEDPGLRFGGCELPHRVVYVNKANQTLSSITKTNRTPEVHLDTKVQTMGPPKADMNDAGGVDVPYVRNGKLHFVDIEKNRGRSLDNKAETQPLAVGDLDGDGKASIYYNRNQNIYKITPNTNRSIVKNSSSFSVQPAALGGIADFDGDGAPELVYRNKNERLAYLESDGTEVLLTHEVKGHAIGKPADFDGDGVARTPVVDENQIWLYGHSGNNDQIGSFSKVAKQPVAPVDIDHDLELEIVFTHTSGGLYYMEVGSPNNGAVCPVNNSDGDVVDANKNKGAK